MHPLTRAILAGLSYFALVFAVGFALGAVRVSLAAPRFGAFVAVVIETPFILTASGFGSLWCIDRFRVGAGLAPRATMGGAAFVALMVAETGLSAFAFGRSLTEQGLALLTPAGALGLAGQVVFALLPVLQGRRWAAARR